MSEAIREHLTVDDLHCICCADLIRREVSVLRGVLHAEVDLPTRRLTVERDPARVDRDEIGRTVRACGYRCDGEPARSSPGSWATSRR